MSIIRQMRTAQGRRNLGRKAAFATLKAVRTGQARNLGVSSAHANNALDLERELARKRNMPQSATNGAPVVENHRLQGHMDKKVARMGRGGDERTRVLNNNNVARRMRDNDPINVDRPLG